MATMHTLCRYPAHIRAIGTISLEVLAMQLELANLLSRVLRIDRRIAHALYMSPKAEQTRLDILRNTATECVAALRKNVSNETRRKAKRAAERVNKIVARAQTAIAYRNRTIHDDWQAPAHDQIARVAVDGRSAKKLELVPITELRKEIENLRRLIDDVIDLTNDFDHDPPFPSSVRGRG